MTPWRTFWIGFLLCCAGVGYAVCVSDMASDGGRGGALAVALSFWILFQSHGSAKAAFDDKDIKIRATRTHNALGALIDVSEKQRMPLALTSVIGTLFWGFGDLLAAWLGAAS